MVTSVYQNMIKYYPDSHFYLLSYYPKADKWLVGNSNISILPGTPLRLLLLTMPLSFLYRIMQSMPKFTRILEKDPIIEALIKSDIILDLGGISFSDGRGIYLPFNIITILPALLMDRKVIKCAQAMGPFEHNINRALAKLILPKLEIIFARGKETLRHLESIELGNSTQANDVAFAMNSSGVDHLKIKGYLVGGDSRLIGISPSSVIYQYAKKKNIPYTEILSKLCDTVVKEYGFSVILIPHSIRKRTEKSKNNDLPVIHEIMKTVKHRDKVTAVYDDLNSSELRAVMQHCDLFIASRFHAMISALSEMIPLIVCCWGHKYNEVMSQFRLEEYTVDYRDLSYDALILKFDKLLHNEPEIRRTIEYYMPEVLRKTYSQFQEIKRIIEHDEQ